MTNKRRRQGPGPQCLGIVRKSSWRQSPHSGHKRMPVHVTDQWETHRASTFPKMLLISSMLHAMIVMLPTPPLSTSPPLIREPLLEVRLSDTIKGETRQRKRPLSEDVASEKEFPEAGQISTAPVTNTSTSPVGEHELPAATLRRRSLEMARELATEPSPTEQQAAPWLRGSTVERSEFSTLNEYRSNEGHTRIEMTTPWGSRHCAELRQADPNQPFEPSLWWMRPC